MTSDIFNHVAKATLRIEAGESSGSGFHFLRQGIIVTNHHVVEGYTRQVFACTADGFRMPIELKAFSPKNEKDFAIFQVIGSVAPSLEILSTVSEKPNLGRRIVFAGFPHGIPHLLLHEAVISGLVSADVFYIDGSVNGGNSGGPIIDAEQGGVLGLVTQRRFLGGPDLEQLSSVARNLRAHCEAIAGRGHVSIMGIDFGLFCGLMAEAMLLNEQVLKANANTGIGIGYSIAPILNSCNELPT